MEIVTYFDLESIHQFPCGVKVESESIGERRSTFTPKGDTDDEDEEEDCIGTYAY